MNTDTDLLILGAGPTGLYAAYYARIRGLRTVVVDALPELGGQVAALYPEKDIYDVAGLPAVKGKDLVRQLVEQAGDDVEYLLGRQAVDLDRDGDVLTVRTDDDERIRTRAVLVAGGIGSFRPRPLDAADRYAGRGAAYFVTDLGDYRDRDVVVVGGGDSALDWALALHPIAGSVTLVHRRDRFRAHAASVDELRRRGATIHTNAEVTAAHGTDSLELVEVLRHEHGDTVRLPAQKLIAALGFTAQLGPLRTWGLELHGQHIVVGRDMATNVPGVYAAGDIAEYPGKVRLMSVGFGEAATAVNHIAHRIDDDVPLFPGHSTDAGPVPS
ncbi:NAD(P)/FAD-dependent oxidoreductase [Rhodococcus aetherivorans]